MALSRRTSTVNHDSRFVRIINYARGLLHWEKLLAAVAIANSVLSRPGWDSSRLFSSQSKRKLTSKSSTDLTEGMLVGSTHYSLIFEYPKYGIKN